MAVTKLLNFGEQNVMKILSKQAFFLSHSFIQSFSVWHNGFDVRAKKTRTGINILFFIRIANAVVAIKSIFPIVSSFRANRKMKKKINRLMRLSMAVVVVVALLLHVSIIFVFCLVFVALFFRLYNIRFFTVLVNTFRERWRVRENAKFKQTINDKVWSRVEQQKQQQEQQQQQ